MEHIEDIFNRTERLSGSEGLEALSGARVILFGLGGVGSWCAEALVRSGVGHLTIVDADRVAVSNINRQLPALVSTVGRPKTEVMAERLAAINPEAEIKAIEGLYTEATSSDFHLEDYDYVIDAIDSLADKAHLILHATSLKRPRLVSSMGAALKMNPEKISVAEFWKVTGCPLAAALRRKFKKGNCSFAFVSSKRVCVCVCVCVCDSEDTLRCLELLAFFLLRQGLLVPRAHAG